MEIAPNLHQLTIPFVVPTPAGAIPRSVNLFLYCGKRITLIDSGVAGAEQALYRYIEELGRRPGEIATLLLTHSHPDHIGAARTIRELSGCRVLAHAAEQSWIEDTELQNRQRPVPGFSTLVAGSLAVDQALAGGERLELENGLTLDILHTPGHSAGSVSLWDRRRGILISGDAAPAPHDLPVFDNVNQSLASLERLEACKAGLLLSAWAGPVRGDAVSVALKGAADWLRHVEAVVRGAAAASPLDPMQLCARVVAELGLPPVAVNPLMARTCLACLDDTQKKHSMQNQSFDIQARSVPGGDNV